MLQLAVKSGTNPGLLSKPDSKTILNDYIGPPDKYSNLRPIVRAEKNNETNLEKQLREKQIEVEEWNQEFWSRHNKRFYEEKDIFIKTHKIAGVDEIPADKMSEFYKAFLDKNKKLHYYYNLSWYMKNFDLLIMSAQVKISRFFKMFKKKE
ncbi:COA8 family protein CG14806, mitochondrial isoform X2 [Condylostylus longicornis]|uniref:COA8 family protein CG14806, mitochondrial isoform X2 n=1 Tax=Condylostylus longicornis TaxID=2530218 RepID=UPI00244E421A|nr:COA8 family protein CG14806, mitochondrial isoform X2 [Condylostylus longicornis]